MALVYADRVKETSTTTGTGTYDLAGAASGFRTFVAGIGNGNLCVYVATMGADYEIGIGTITDAGTDTLARTSVRQSTNGNAAVNWGAGTKSIFCAPVALLNPFPMRGYLWDLTMSNAADANNDITVAAGVATDEAGEVVMTLAASITKQLDAGWAVGNNAGGLNTGAKAANTWYEVHLIQRIDTGVVDVMFTTTANRNTLPSNYTHKRRIGWIRTDGSSNIRAFSQYGDYFTLLTPINDVGVAKTTTATAVTLTVPPNSIARFRAGADANTTVNANAVVIFREIAENDTAPSATDGNGSLGYADLATLYSAGHFELRASASSQVEHDSSVAQGNLDISTYGWIDDRCRDKN